MSCCYLEFVKVQDCVNLDESKRAKVTVNWTGTKMGPLDLLGAATNIQTSICSDGMASSHFEADPGARLTLTPEK